MPVNPLEENLGRKLTKVTVSLFSLEVWIHLCMDLFFGPALLTVRILTQSPK